MIQDFFLRYPQGRDRALTFSYDDGVEQDLRLIDLFARHGLKGTFNLNSGLFSPEGTVHPEGSVQRRMTQRQAVEALRGTPHEIGLHGVHHLYWEQLPFGRVTYEILEDRARLEALFHTLVRGGAYPYGTWNDQAVEALRAGGVAYCRTVVSSGSFELPQDWLRLSPTCHHNDPALPSLIDRFLTDRLERKPYLFYLWGHSYEFERDDNWALIEQAAQRLGGRGEVYYATNIELCDYVAAFRALRFSANGTLVENPSAIPVWYRLRERTGCLNPGERASLA